MSPLEAAWLSLQERWPGSFERFQEVVTGWDVHPVFIDDEPVGAILVNGPEIHACIAKGYGRWFRKEQAAILNAVIEKHGYAQTHATTEAGERFVRRLGFVKHGVTYRRKEPWVLKH